MIKRCKIVYVYNAVDLGPMTIKLSSPLFGEMLNVNVIAVKLINVSAHGKFWFSFLTLLSITQYGTVS